MNKKLSVIVISITPFDAHGKLDEPAFRQHLRRLRDAGVSVYVGGSASSEAFTYTPEERDRVLAIAVEELKGKVSVRTMGCEPRLPSEMVDFLQSAERAKVDAAQICSLDIGHGARPTDVELDRYYSTVIESTALPVTLSSHRAAGYFLPLDLIERLAKRYPNVTGLHYGGADIPQLSEIIERFGDRLEIHCAGPALALTTLGLGGNGFMGGEGNFAPQLVANVISAFQACDMELLRDSFRKLMAFVAINVRYAKSSSSMRGLKPLLNAFGLPGGTLRPPRVSIGGADLAAMIQDVLRLKLPGIPSLASGASKS